MGNIPTKITKAVLSSLVKSPIKEATRFGPNLIANGDFMTDLTGWGVDAANSTMEWDDGKLKLTRITDAAQWSAATYGTASNTCTVGHWYEVSAEFEIVAIPTDFIIIIGVWDTTNKYFSREMDPLSKAPGFTTRIAYRYQAQDDNPEVRAAIYKSGSSGHIVKVDNVKLRKIL